jgi:hypothetical protein
MRRRITVALLACASLAVGAPLAAGQSPEAKYRALRAEVVQKHGERAPGRNIVRDGVRTKHGARPARLADITQSIEVMRRMLAPPTPAPTPASSSTPVAAISGLQSQASAPSGGGACNAIPGYIVQRESGGNPAAVNSSSGAFGCYQLMPEHFAGGGACADLSRDQAGQDKCAARLWDGGRGSGNWAATR